LEGVGRRHRAVPGMLKNRYCGDFFCAFRISARSIFFSKQETQHDLDSCSDGDWQTTLVPLAQVLDDNLSRNCFTDSYIETVTTSMYEVWHESLLYEGD
jgi:hypothetical protein